MHMQTLDDSIALSMPDALAISGSCMTAINEPLRYQSC